MEVEVRATVVERSEQALAQMTMMTPYSGCVAREIEAVECRCVLHVWCDIPVGPAEAAY
eukprot:XP_001694004.1 predicted protein [Chlamydomonas reinhardtii]